MIIYFPKALSYPLESMFLGIPLVYALDEDILLNQASIREIYTLLVDHSGGELIYTSSIQNTAKEDTKPSKDGAFWPPFGEPQFNKSEKTMTLSNVGWCIASHSLYMQEGERTVTSTLDFGANQLSITNENLIDKFDIFFQEKQHGFLLKASISVTKITDGHEKLQFTVTLENCNPQWKPTIKR